MTIDNLEAIVSPSSEDLLLIRHGGKEWKYPLSTMASNLINDPTISAATLGTASHPFETANITTLNVGGSGTVNGNLTVRATTDTTEASLLKVGKTLTIKGDTTVDGTLSTGRIDASNTEATNLYTTNLGTENSPITTVAATTFNSGTLKVINTANITGSDSTGTSSIAGRAAFTSGSLNVRGDTSIGGNFSTLDGLTGSLNIIKGSATIDNGFSSVSLEVKGSSTIKGQASISGDIDAGSLSITDSIEAKALSMTGGTLTVGSSGEVTVGSSSNTNAEISSSGVLTLNCDSSFGSDDVSGGDSTLSKKCALHSKGSIYCVKTIWGSQVFNAVWNDLADCIPVNKEAVIEPGYCYCFDGEKYYKSTKYLEKGIIGIESDTYGMHMGSKPGVKQMDVAVSGFALAYVDKEYESGTPLTCTENGYLTEIAKQDKIEYPERIVGTYWKPEPNEEWGSSDRKVKVNGRHWIKIR